MAFSLYFLNYVKYFPFAGMTTLFVYVTIYRVIPLCQPRNRAALIYRGVTKVIQLSVTPILVFP